MRVTEQIETARAVRWEAGDLSWGLVPTMGDLHEGHLSLVRAARAANDRVAVTIYVNPTQFAPDEDFDSYPRNPERDLSLLRDEGVDLVFHPADSTMYPADFQTAVTVEKVTTKLEGASRPTHFQGVTTIVAKLFNIVQPTRAYFGQKDYQQTVVLRQMVRDLNFNLEIVVCPIVREADGLALSSRNRYLNPAQRTAATVLFRALTAARQQLDQGERDGESLRALMAGRIAAEPLAIADYVSVAHPDTLEELDEVGDAAVLSMAVQVGRTRLIDNMLWPEPGEAQP